MYIANGGSLHESHSSAPRQTTYRDFRGPGGLPPLQIGEALIPALRSGPIDTAGAIAVTDVAAVDSFPDAEGGLLIAGALTFAPGRLMHRLFFG